MTQDFKQFVLGFCTTQDGRVCLVKKDIESYGGRGWNGVGGRVEAGESPLQAMGREWREETGLRDVLWVRRGEFMGAGYQVHVFAAHIEHPVGPTSGEADEKWHFHPIRQVLCNFMGERRRPGDRTCALVPPLIALCEEEAHTGGFRLYL